VQRVRCEELDMGSGRARLSLELLPSLYYDVLSELAGEEIRSEAALFSLVKELADVRRKYARVEEALESVEQSGYGIVMPSMEELKFEQPEISKQGGRYGVRLKASAPSIHMIMTNVETEINPIVGSESQSEELIRYLLAEFEDSPEKLRESNIFGKSLSSLVNDGLQGKLYRMPMEARGKLQETLERIINEGSRGLICILL
jgi:stage IV sporulation protein A